MGKLNKTGPKFWDTQFSREWEAILKVGELSNSLCPEH